MRARSEGVSFLAALMPTPPEQDNAYGPLQFPTQREIGQLQPRLPSIAWRKNPPNGDGSHGSPCLGQAISTSMKKGDCHEKDCCNSGTGLRTHHRHGTDNGLWVWPFPT